MLGVFKKRDKIIDLKQRAVELRAKIEGQIANWFDVRAEYMLKLDRAISKEDRYRCQKRLNKIRRHLSFLDKQLRNASHKLAKIELLDAK